MLGKKATLSLLLERGVVRGSGCTVWGESLGRDSLRTESRWEVNKGPVVEGAGYICRTKGRWVWLECREGLGRTICHWALEEGKSQIRQHFGGHRKAFGIYLESKVESSQEIGLCLNLLLREFRKKSLNIENIQHNYYSLC